MKELVTAKGIIKFKELNILEVSRLQGRLMSHIRKVFGEEAEGLTENDYTTSVLELILDRFDFSEVDGVEASLDAIEDVDLFLAMLTEAELIIGMLGDLIKKKSLLKTPIISTPKASKGKSSKA